MCEVQFFDEITAKLMSGSKHIRHEGYKMFLKRTHWLNREKSFPEETLRRYASRVLNVHIESLLIESERSLNPRMLWATQDSLEECKIKMVEEAYRYSVEFRESFPPIVVVKLPENRPHTYIVVDGHHRVFFFNRIGRKVPAVVLTPLDEDTVRRRLTSYLRINKRVVDLPIHGCG